MLHKIPAGTHKSILKSACQHYDVFMNARVQLYTWSNCPFCVRAKQLLKSEGIAFEEVDLDGRDDELQALRQRTGWQTVPQIFIDGQMIGGFQELARLASQGELSRLK